MKTTISMRRGMNVPLFAIFCIFMGNITTMFAQEYFNECGTDFLQEFNDPINTTPPFTGSIDPAYLETFEPVVFNIFFWQVNDPNGQFDDPITQNDVLTAVANLNIAFNDFNIFFKYRGFDVLDSAPNQPEYMGNGGLDCTALPQIDPEGFSDLHACEIYELLDYAKSINKWKDYAFNIYVANSSPSFAGATDYRKSEAYIVRSGLTTPVLLHEIGHCFHLLHTFNKFDDTTQCEHVTRDPTLDCSSVPAGDPCFNAITKGDYVPDTSAVPNFTVEWCYANGYPLDCADNNPDFEPYFNIQDCAYVGTSTDCQNTYYIILDSDVQNFMAYTVASCRNNFTIGQGIRMREAIDRDSLGNFAQTIDSVSSLYEPYTGEYYISGPAQFHQNQPLFQPGFDYTFLSCSCANQDNYNCVNGPCEFEENNFQSSFVIVDTIDKYESNYNIITHPNHSSISIGQLDQYGKRRCYDNWNRAAVEGSLTKFNDGVFNNNVTITPQDSTNINNPNLIDTMQPGLYKIEKTYEDGSSQEAVILKDNNE